MWKVILAVLTREGWNLLAFSQQQILSATKMHRVSLLVGKDGEGKDAT